MIMKLRQSSEEDVKRNMLELAMYLASIPDETNSIEMNYKGIVFTFEMDLRNMEGNQ